MSGLDVSDWVSILRMVSVGAKGAAGAMFMWVVMPKLSIPAFLATCVFDTCKNAVFSYVWNRRGYRSDSDKTCSSGIRPWIHAVMIVVACVNLTIAAYIAYLVLSRV